jgi:hypothetical protein
MRKLGLVIFYPLNKEANMLSLKSLFAFAVLVPLVGAAIPAEAAKAAKSNASAARAECFRQANEAVAAVGFNPTTADKNAVGQDAYRQCCFKAGIRP